MFIFASLIICNNKSYLATVGYAMWSDKLLNWQLLFYFITKPKLNMTHIEIPVSKIYCVWYNKNIFMNMLAY